MLKGKVVGTIVSTNKFDALRGYKFLEIQHLLLFGAVLEGLKNILILQELFLKRFEICMILPLQN